MSQIEYDQPAAGPMSEIELHPLVGTNPLCLLAALGALDVVTRSLPGARPTLRWTEGLSPRAVLTGPNTLDQLIELVEADRARWKSSPVLNGPPGSAPPADLKPVPADLSVWAEAVLGTMDGEGRADADLFSALMAEGAVAGKGDTKPTHLHFTAGQQRFLIMVRDLRDKLTGEDMDEALRGPWQRASSLPTLAWDARGERIYALRGTNPAKEKRTGEPGADWLAFLGLRFFPVAAARGGLLTTGCAPNWKRGSFTWPLWSVPLPAQVVRSLMGQWATLAQASPTELRALGVSQVLQASIRRSEQGGYGSFGPSAPVQGARVDG